MHLAFTVMGKITPKQRPRFGRGRTYTPEPTRAYEELIAWTAKAAGARPFTVPCEVSIDTYFALPMSMSANKKFAKFQERCTNHKDIDNCAKSVLDSLNGIAYKDDSQVWKLTVAKQWADFERVEVLVEYDS